MKQVSSNIGGLFSLQPPEERSIAVRYGFAVLVVAATTVVSLLLRPSSFETPFLFFYPAPLLALLFGGKGPAWFSAVLAGLAADFFQLPPYGAWALHTFHLSAFTYFVLIFGIVAWIVDRHRQWAGSEIDRQRALLNLAEEPIGIRDSLGRVIFWNRGAERTFGWTAAEALGKDPYDLLKTKFPVSREQTFREFLAKGHWSGEVVHQRKDGQYLTVIAYWTLNRDIHGREDSTLFVSHDITKQRELEWARKTFEERLAAIVRSAMDAIITLDSEQKIVLFNKAAEDIFRISASEILGKRIDMFIPEQFRFAHSAYIQNFAQSGTTSRSMYSPAVLIGRRADGEEFPFEATISHEIVQGEDYFTVILRDITQRKRTEEALIRSEKLASLGRLSASVAHELNNPLSVVNDLLFLIEAEPSLEDHIRRNVRTARTELTHAIEITKRTLGFSKGGMLAKVRPAKSVQNVLTLMSSRMSQKAVVCDIELLSDCEITAVETELRQIFWNLLGNGLDAVQHGGRIKLRISQRHANGGTPGVRITIADNGPGINKETLKHLFEPFYTTKETGNGLGLWVISELLKKHGGSIRVRSRSGNLHGNGAVFSVWLPAESRMENFAAQKAS